MADEVIIEQAVSLGRLTGIVFDVMSNNDIKMLCKANIKETNDLTSAQMGLPTTSSSCDTCGFTNIRDCEGHNGVIKLPRTIYHPYFVHEIVQLLNKICPGCRAIKKDIRIKGSLTENPETDEDTCLPNDLGKNLTATERKILKLCMSNNLFPTQDLLTHTEKVQLSSLKKSSKTEKDILSENSEENVVPESCKYCARSGNEWYPAMKFKIASSDMLGKRPLSVLAEVDEKLPKKFQNKNVIDVLPDDYWDVLRKGSQQCQQASKGNRIIVSPYQAFCLLKDLDPGFINQFVSRREILFLSYLPVTPNSYRLVETSYAFSDGPLLSFDERTKAYKRLVDTNKKVDEFIQHQQILPFATSYIGGRALECLNVSKLCSSSSTEKSSRISGSKWLKDILLSKRSDNAFRMIMIGDPKVKFGEIGIPYDIAENLYVSENVNAYNLEKLNTSCTLLLLKKDEVSSRCKGKLTPVHKTNQLQIGDIVCRPLENGDLILVNRPPSVHQHSLIGLTVKTLPTQFAVSINPLCCAPFYGDFDGDCVHGYVPQSFQSRAELKELVTLDNQLLNAQDGRSLISLTHDSLTAAHMLTARRVLLNKYEMQQLGMLCPFTLPPPSIVKAPNLNAPSWTGEQLFSMLLPPEIDFSTSESTFVKNGELLYSSGSSFWLQNNSASIFSSMFQKYGRKALDFLYAAQEILCEFLTIRGFSVSLGDVYLCSDKDSRKKMIDEVRYGLEEAENASQIKQLLLDSETEILLNSYHENADSNMVGCTSDYEYAFKTKPVSHTSISAFKDVYQDLQSSIYQHLNRENSILAMIHSGSKGSLLKLVQQGACLGMQLSSRPLPFVVPHELSCASWNKQKRMDREALYNATGKVWDQNSYTVVKSSFVDGLNPLQCLVHAISGRSNLFSENAELPGTLTRKLMFHMRDLYAAYDGTVRNTYGQQIIQFPYGGNNSGCHELVGQAVGSWAACTISEAAYGGLDHPVNSMEVSPLVKLKKLLECGKGTCLQAALFLSKRLGGWRYGPEYGALEVKNHLEKTHFSDLVTVVLISYQGGDAQRQNFSPWITHFHVNKEILIRKRLKTHCILNKVEQFYNSMREKMDVELPRLHFMIQDCSLVYKEGDGTCISVAAENSGSHVQLTTIKSLLIPLILGTLIKGFWEVDKVEVMCNSQPGSHELFLRVTMSDICLPGMFWDTLLNVCIPIMDLIDWQRSHPDNLSRILSTYGIDSAWKYFLQSLKLTTDELGRKVLQQHLLLVADCLSVTGEFHGLSASGLKKQRKQASVSSPFNQACLSGPGSCFLAAAKKGSRDGLLGTLDAVAWGNEAPVGTGGPFEILYAEKVHDERRESIYETLLTFNAEESSSEVHKLHNSAKSKPKPALSVTRDKYRPSGFHEDHLQEKYLPEVSTRSFKCRPSRNLAHGIGHMEPKAHQLPMFNSKALAHVVDLCLTLRRILHLHPLNECLNDDDKSAVLEAIMYHPKKNDKIGDGIKEIKIGHSLSHPGSRCFSIIRNNGTIVDFSYRKCVIGAAKKISPEIAEMVEKKLYHG